MIFIIIIICVFHLHCISERSWGSGWLPPTPAGWRFPAGSHTHHTMTKSASEQWHHYLAENCELHYKASAGYNYSSATTSKKQTAVIWTPGRALYYLGFNPNLDEAADDGEYVTDHEQKIPAVNELHSVSPAHTAAKSVFEELHILLNREMRNDQWHEECYDIYIWNLNKHLLETICQRITNTHGNNRNTWSFTHKPKGNDIRILTTTWGQRKPFEFRAVLKE